MPSDLQVSNLKALDGTAGISIADSTGRVSFTETNPTLTLGSNATFPSGMVTNVFAYNTTGTEYANATQTLKGLENFIYTQELLQEVKEQQLLLAILIKENTELVIILVQQQTR